MMLKSELAERVSSLINQSVESMASSLDLENNLDALEIALRICKRRGEITKVAMLQRKLRKIAKGRVVV